MRWSYGEPKLTRRSVLAGIGGVALAPLIGCAGTLRPAEPSPPADATGPVRRAPIDQQPRIDVERAEQERSRLQLPDRDPGAETGSQFIARTARLRRAKFEEAAFAALTSGNVPPFQRTLVPVKLRTEGPRGRVYTAEVHVLCDYLAIGSDEDFVRIPLAYRTAQRIATRARAVLPTTKLVDAIWEQAQIKLYPSYIVGGPNLSNHWDYAKHNSELEEQRTKRRLRLGELTAGDKKDIVISNRLLKKQGRVAIYGWQREDGSVIQPLSTVHGKNYADYSHGVRLVADNMTVDDSPRRVEDVLRDKDLCMLLSYEGALEIVAYPI